MVGNTVRVIIYFYFKSLFIYCTTINEINEIFGMRYRIGNLYATKMEQIPGRKFLVIKIGFKCRIRNCFLKSLLQLQSLTTVNLEIEITRSNSVSLCSLFSYLFLHTKLVLVYKNASLASPVKQ